MNYCNNCDSYFDDEDFRVVEQGVPYGEGSAYFSEYQCPYCHSNDIEDCKRCSVCEEHCAESQLVYNDIVDDDVCPYCDERLNKEGKWW